MATCSASNTTARGWGILRRGSNHASSSSSSSSSTRHSPSLLPVTARVTPTAAAAVAARLRRTTEGWLSLRHRRHVLSASTSLPVPGADDWQQQRRPLGRVRHGGRFTPAAAAAAAAAATEASPSPFNDGGGGIGALVEKCARWTVPVVMGLAALEVYLRLVTTGMKQLAGERGTALTFIHSRTTPT